MEAGDLIKKVRRIEITSRALSRHLLAGQYHSAFRGTGMSFTEVRSYQFGDDVRNIDWNVTARTGTPHIKVFEEERELTTMLVADVSASNYFATKGQLKINLITEISAVLAFSALQNNDKVGLILFSDRVELYIPPGKGRTHVLRIIREMVNFEPSGNRTDLTAALEFLNRVHKKRSICFVLSDFMCSGYAQAVAVTAQRHDLIGLHISDPADRVLPRLGVIRALDPESRKQVWVDTLSASVAKAYTARFDGFAEQLQSVFARNQADLVKLTTDKPYIPALMRLFKVRTKR